jgi:ubiquitin C-terminal hydrolase
MTITPLPLRNLSGTECFRNSVLHSLFSIDYFLNLLNEGRNYKDNQIYQWLQSAAQSFRTGNDSNAVEISVRRAMNKMRSHSSQNQAGKLEKFSQSGYQEDAADFLSHVMARLCTYEVDNKVFR